MRQYPGKDEDCSGKPKRDSKAIRKESPSGSDMRKPLATQFPFSAAVPTVPNVSSDQPDLPGSDPRAPVIFSFFAGLGFLDLGFEKAGYRVAYVNEFHAPFLSAYQFARTRMRLPGPLYGYFHGDVAELVNGRGAEISEYVRETKRSGRLVGFVGGPPCPDFSIGGKNRGSQGENGKLSATYVQLITNQKPDFFLFENVKGLWQTKRHRAFFEELKGKLHSEGYATTERVINALEYGVAQDRPRILLVGVSRELLHDLRVGFDVRSMEIEHSQFPWAEGAPYPGSTAFQFPWPQTTPFAEGSSIPCPDGIPVQLTVEHWFRKNRVEHHENAVHCFKPRAAIDRFLSVAEGDDSRKSSKRLHRWRYSPTVCYGNNEVHLHPYKARRISAAEALALQSLPTEFTLPENMTLSDMFKGIGNGVPLLAAKAIAQSLRRFLTEGPHETHGD